MKKKAAEFMTRAAALVLDLIFPPHCVFCDAVVATGRQVCEKCAAEIIPDGKADAIFLSSDRAPIECTYLYPYEGKTRDSILNFKFHGQKINAAYYAEKLAAQIAVIYPRANFDAVTAVPLSPERLRERGYNQSELLAKKLAGKLGLPYLALLKKEKNNKTQHLLKREERIANVRGVYVPAEGTDCSGKKLLLVDDIVTTGSTLRACASVLLQEGAASVACAVIAKAEPGPVEKETPV